MVARVTRGPRRSSTFRPAAAGPFGVLALSISPRQHLETLKKDLPTMPSTSQLHTAHRELAYTGDAAALFYALATPRNSLLLESADIESKKNLTCIAITKAALKVVCHGQQVTATALTGAGRVLLDELRADFHSRMTDSAEDSATFRFELSTEHDERARLRATSTADILRTLQFSRLYSGESLPFLGGGFAFDYVDTFEQLPPVPPG